MTAQRHTAISVTPTAREELRSLVYALIGATERRVSMSEALIAACKRARTDIPATVAALPPYGKDDDR